MRLCTVYKKARRGYKAQFKRNAMEIPEEEFVDQLLAQISSEAFKSDTHKSLKLNKINN